MYILDVIPLTILPQNVPQILSYFNDAILPKGSVVEISMGNRKINAVVVSASPLEQEKANLKKTLFQLKKINSVINPEPQISQIQFKIALWIARYYHAPLGYCLKTVLPPFFLKKKYPSLINKIDAAPLEKSVKPSFVISRARDSIDKISKLIEKTNQNSLQSLVIVPDKTILEYLNQTFSLKYKTVIISSGLPDKELYKSWEDIASGKAELILGTRQALFAPFKNLGLIIAEDPLHEFYKSDMVPKYNTPDLAKKVANIYGSKIIFISPFIGVEDYFGARNSQYDLEDLPDKKERPIEIVDMVNEIKEYGHSVLSRKLKEQLIFAIQQKNKILIFSSRRGHSGILICENCSSVVKCPDCDIPMRIHKSTDMILVCHYCSRTQSIPKYCPNCSGKYLKPVGPAGSQKIYDNIKRLLEYGQLGKVPVLILDTDVVKNEVEEEETMKGTAKSGASILIATQMIFSHRYAKQFDLIGITNFDALNPTPDFKAEENLIYQIEKILDFNPGKLLIQTYNRQEKVLKHIASGDYKEFYEKELEAREAFAYPPFSKLIKLSYKDKRKEKASYACRIAVEKLKMAISREGLTNKVRIIGSSPAFTEKEKGFYLYNIILKIDHSLANFGDILKYAPPGWSVDVDPRSIL